MGTQTFTKKRGLQRATSGCLILNEAISKQRLGKEAPDGFNSQVSNGGPKSGKEMLLETKHLALWRDWAGYLRELENGVLGRGVDEGKGPARGSVQSWKQKSFS